MQSFAPWQQTTIEITWRDHSIIACSHHAYIYLCSSRTPRSWWITQSMQRHQRGCNNIPSFLQWTAPIARFFVWRLNSARPPHPGHSTILLRSEILSGMCAKLRTVAASNNRDHLTRSLYYCLFAPRIYIFVLRAHPARGESHNQRNDTREVATVRKLSFSGIKPKITSVTMGELLESQLIHF